MPSLHTLNPPYPVLNTDILYIDLSFFNCLSPLEYEFFENKGYNRICIIIGKSFPIKDVLWGIICLEIIPKSN